MKGTFFVKVHYHNGRMVTATHTAEIIAVAGHGFKMKVRVHHVISWRELGPGQLFQGLDSPPNSLISLTIGA